MQTCAPSGSSVFFKWKSPQRISGSRQLTHIPVEIYDEIFAWLRPSLHPDMDKESQHKVLARLAVVCRYFAYYKVREISRCLDFDGLEQSSKPRTPTSTWCTGIINRCQPMETLRLEVRECTIQNWINQPGHHPDEERIGILLTAFLKRFPLLLLRLDNLGTLTFFNTLISPALVRSVGRLRVLRQLVIWQCIIDNRSGVDPDTAIFGKGMEPFPALRQLTMQVTPSGSCMDRVFADAFTVLGATPTLVSLCLADADWLPFMLPYISPHLTSFSASLSLVNVDTFVTFLKGHPALTDLSICFQIGAPRPRPLASMGFERFYHSTAFFLASEDLPHLRSFSGPPSLASRFITDRSVSKVALSPLPEMCCSTRSVSLPFLYGPMLGTLGIQAFFIDGDTDKAWKNLKTSGAGIQELFIRISPVPSTTLISAQFPNLVRLQLEVFDRGVDKFEPQKMFMSSLGKTLKGLKSLNSLILCGGISGERLIYKLSPGHQYDFVSEWHTACPTLCTVFFGNLMIWHLCRSPPNLPTRSPSQSIQNLYELELLSPRMLRRELQELAKAANPVCIRDWQDKIDGIFSEGYFRLGLEIKSILMNDHGTS